MEQVKIADAKARLSALLERVEQGEEILIARRDKAIARLVPEPRPVAQAAQALRPASPSGGLVAGAVSAASVSLVDFLLDSPLHGLELPPRDPDSGREMEL